MKQFLAILVICEFTAGTLWASPSDGVWSDAEGDAVIRRTDLGNDAPLPVGFEPIDLLSIAVQGWEPALANIDPYTGSIIEGDADFVRIEITLAGLVSPPGPIGLGGFAYDPYRFGDRPLTGFVDLDVDDQKDSGGELMPLARNRYLANVARFGRSPRGSIGERIAQSNDDLDSDFFTGAEIERTGAEFTLVLCGCFSPTIVSQNGDADSNFDAGETWVVRGRFFERFESFQPAGATFGGSGFGLFDPVVDLRFVHDAGLNQTTITLVFPITNAGAALIANEAEQSIDLSLLNHTSIEEALDDLIVGADFASGALAIMTDDWRNQDLTEYRQPQEWKATALIGTAPVVAQPASFYIWTDTGFDEHIADFNLDEILDASDALTLGDFVNDTDGSSGDADGVVNGQVEIENFGLGFHFYDLNYDGFVSLADTPVLPCPADFTGEGVLDIFDVFGFLDAFGASDPAADFTADGLFDIFDVFGFLDSFNAGCP